MKKKIMKITGIIENALALFFGSCMVCLTLLQVFCRYIMKNPPPWSEELAKVCFIWVVYIGMSMTCRRKGHVTVDHFVQKLPKAFHKWTGFIVDFITLIFLAVMTCSGILLVKNTTMMMMTSVKLPMGITYASIALMGLVMTAYYLLFTYDSLLNVLKKPTDSGSKEA